MTKKSAPPKQFTFMPLILTLVIGLALLGLTQLPRLGNTPTPASAQTQARIQSAKPPRATKAPRPSLTASTLPMPSLTARPLPSATNYPQPTTTVCKPKPMPDMACLGGMPLELDPVTCTYKCQDYRSSQR